MLLQEHVAKTVAAVDKDFLRRLAFERFVQQVNDLLNFIDLTRLRRADAGSGAYGRRKFGDRMSNPVFLLHAFDFDRNVLLAVNMSG